MITPLPPLSGEGVAVLAPVIAAGGVESVRLLFFSFKLSDPWGEKIDQLCQLSFLTK